MSPVRIGTSQPSLLFLLSNTKYSSYSTYTEQLARPDWTLEINQECVQPGYKNAHIIMTWNTCFPQLYRSHPSLVRILEPGNTKALDLHTNKLRRCISASIIKT